MSRVACSRRRICRSVHCWMSGYGTRLMAPLFTCRADGTVLLMAINIRPRAAFRYMETGPIRRAAGADSMPAITTAEAVALQIRRAVAVTVVMPAEVTPVVVAVLVQPRHR